MIQSDTVQIIVHGKVQGVGFRRATKRLANTMLITGTVENKADGTVKIIAQGKKLQPFIYMLQQSPTPYGMVSSIDITPIASNSYHHFQIKY
jgi:acylphosphatase